MNKCLLKIRQFPEFVSLWGHPSKIEVSVGNFRYFKLATTANHYVFSYVNDDTNLLFFENLLNFRNIFDSVLTSYSS